MEHKKLFWSEPVVMEYLIYLPDSYDGETELPLVVFLHGAGERGKNIELVKKNGLPKYISEGKKYPAVILSPQCPGGIVWSDMPVIIKGVIDRVIKDYRIDTSRVSITGISMGGFGTWEMGIVYNDFFSAIAPVCGGGMTWRCDALKNMPIRAFHGKKDDCVPLSCSTEMVDAVNKCGGNAELTVFEQDGHNSWDSAYLTTDVVDWLINQRRA